MKKCLTYALKLIPGYLFCLGALDVTFRIDVAVQGNPHHQYDAWLQAEQFFMVAALPALFVAPRIFRICSSAFTDAFNPGDFARRPVSPEITALD